MPKRIQSPSSINVYNQCPRRYYYQYIRKLRSLPSIHLTKGKVVHAALASFFNFKTESVDWADFKQKMQLYLQDCLVAAWKEEQKDLDLLNLSKEQEMLYFEESLLILFSWLGTLSKKIDAFRNLPFSEAFAKLTPMIREKFYQSNEHFVRGFIDAVQQFENEIRIVDYKTSKKTNLDDHKLQIAIYSLLYLETHGAKPDKAGIHFLKQEEPQFIDVDEELLDFAKREIALIHERTVSVDMADYPKSQSPLCKWSSGCCDFYVPCQKE